MKKIFEAKEFFRVPDGTMLSPFLNSTDSMENAVSSGILGGLSIASGKLEPGEVSWIHVLPAIMQVTYVLKGNLLVKMKEQNDDNCYSLSLSENQAVVTQPMTLFQLENKSSAICELLYISSPSYVFLKEGSVIQYDDSIMVSKDWQELRDVNFNHPNLDFEVRDINSKRASALEKLRNVR